MATGTPWRARRPGRRGGAGGAVPGCGLGPGGGAWALSGRPGAAGAERWAGGCGSALRGSAPSPRASSSAERRPAGAHCRQPAPAGPGPARWHLPAPGVRPQRGPAPGARRRGGAGRLRRGRALGFWGGVVPRPPRERAPPGSAPDRAAVPRAVPWGRGRWRLRWRPRGGRVLVRPAELGRSFRPGREVRGALRSCPLPSPAAASVRSGRCLPGVAAAAAAGTGGARGERSSPPAGAVSAVARPG